MESRYPIVEEYDKDHRARYIEERQVTTIVIFLYINIHS
jgi:hypothetical protein